MEKKPSIIQFTMTYGAILGIVSIIFSLFLYMAGIMPYNLKRIILIGLISLIIMIAFLVVGTKAYRDKVLGGTITYWNAVLVGMLIIVFSTILGSFYNLIFNLFIDPEYTDKVIEASKSWWYDYLNNMGAPDASIEDTMNRLDRQQANSTPMKSFFQSIYTSIIFGLILSLITSAFIKKNPKPFSETPA
jgi:hypothetical protein